MAEYLHIGQTERYQETPDHHLAKEAYYELSDIMAEGNPELVALNKRYKEFMNMRNTLARVFYDESGNVKSKGLERLFKKGAERSRQVTFEKFAQQWPQAKQIMIDAVKFNRRQLLKTVAGRAALVGGGYWALRKLLGGLAGGISGEGSVEGFSDE